MRSPTQISSGLLDSNCWKVDEHHRQPLLSSTDTNQHRSEETMKYQRKRMPVAAGIAILALAACGSDGGDTGGAADTGNESGDSSTESPDGAAGDVTLDILSWWTAGGEAEALDAVVDGFATDHANITIENSA